MAHANVVVTGTAVPDPVQTPPADFPLQTLVLNLTNQCNLSCQYCYEFGADKVATPEGKPKFMDFETAKASVDFLLQQSAGRKSIHVTFFGGETLMNFPLLKKVVDYAKQKAADQGRSIDFYLSQTRGITAAQAFFRKALATRCGHGPHKITLEGHRPSHRVLRLLRREHAVW